VVLVEDFLRVKRDGIEKRGTATLAKGYQSGNGLRSARVVAGWEPL
jgi:hypothetical protein